jgi:Tfp pilus assembly protein PilO
MFGLSGLATKLIIAGMVAAALAGFWFHYQGLHSTIAQLEGDKRQLETAVDLKDNEIAAMQDMAASRAERAQVSRKALWAAQAQVDGLEAKLERHDLAMLVKRKPGLMTRRAKAGTRAIFRKIERAANETLQ